MRFDVLVQARDRVKLSISLLEDIEYNEAAHKALKELRPVLGSLDVEVNRLKEKEGGKFNGVE